jgi:hypothetical protein
VRGDQLLKRASITTASGVEQCSGTGHPAHDRAPR